MPAENTPTPAGGVTMSLFPYSRAAFDYTSGLIRAWHDVPAIVAGETIILGQLLDVAHTEALTENTNRMMSAAFDADTNLHTTSTDDEISAAISAAFNADAALCYPFQPDTCRYCKRYNRACGRHDTIVRY